jgi:hypothetical protein
MEEILRPVVVSPDKDPFLIEKSEAIAALNVRLGNYNPKGGTGVRKVLGNLLIANPYLPAGTNKVIGGTKDPAGRLLYLNWNSNGNHAIYCYNPSIDPFISIAFQLVLQGTPLDGLTSTMKVSMAFDNGYLIWNSKDIEEPRQIDVDRGINTYLSPQRSPYYLLPIAPWETFRIQRVPKVPLEAITSFPYDVYNFIPKPNPLATDQGYQFTYNYEFINNIEGRLGPPTRPFWNQSDRDFTLRIPSSEYPFLRRSGQTNSYIVAIRYYFRVGNTGEWTYFKRILNTASGNNIDITFKDFSTLSAIGVPSVAALLGADGIARRVDDSIFADSRIVDARLITGHAFDLPTATVTVEPQDNIFTRGLMSFAPLNTQTVETALVFFDAQDRIIGGRINTPQVLTRTDQVYINLGTINSANPEFFDSDKNFQQVWNYFSINSNQDTKNNPAIKITPTGAALPSVVAKVMLATKPQKGYSIFLRTQCRVYPLYQWGEEIVITGNTTNEFFTTTSPTKQWRFYGIAFEFVSGQPINFSTEQNYYIEVRGITGGTTGEAATGNAFFRKSFKITEQIGSLLVARPKYSEIGVLTFSFITVSGGSNVESYNLANFSQRIADIVIYSKDNSDKPWQLVPSVSWNAAEWGTTAQYYYGDAYATQDEKTLETSITRNMFYSTVDGQEFYITDFGPGLSLIDCQGTFASMNLNGIYQESWDSNVGNIISIDENPVEKNLLSFTRHGEQYLLGTQINNIFTFNPLNEDHTQSQLGPITKVVLLGINDANGNNLYYICENGVEMVFLGRTQQVGTDGNSVMSLSTKVFGSHNVLRLPYGAQSKTDVTTTDSGVVFYVDNKRKILVQISGNGQDPISIQKGFQSDIRLIGNESVIGFDPLYKEVLVTSAGFGLAYNMKDDSYQGFRNFGPKNNELFLWNSLGNQQKMFGFSGGDLYEYNVGVMFFAQPIEIILDMIVKGNPDMLKRAGCMEIMSTENSTFDVELLSYTSLPNGVPNKTRIAASEFKLSEGNQFAVFKNSILSTGGKFNGLPMHGYMYKLTLSSIDSLDKQLSFIKFIYSVAQTNQG